MSVTSSEPTKTVASFPTPLTQVSVVALSVRVHLDKLLEYLWDFITVLLGV